MHYYSKFDLFNFQLILSFHLSGGPKQLAASNAPFLSKLKKGFGLMNYQNNSSASHSARSPSRAEEDADH